MPKGFLVLICIVIVATLFFALVIWRQTIHFEKKAAVFKQRKEEYLKELEEEEARKAAEEAENAAQNEAQTETGENDEISES